MSEIGLCSSRGEEVCVCLCERERGSPLQVLRSRLVIHFFFRSNDIFPIPSSEQPQANQQRCSNSTGQTIWRRRRKMKEERKAEEVDKFEFGVPGSFVSPPWNDYFFLTDPRGGLHSKMAGMDSG